MIKELIFKSEFHPFTHGESFDFKPITLLVGDQGAGKSTILDLIMKYETPKLAEVNTRYNKDGSSNKGRGSYMNADLLAPKSDIIDVLFDGDLSLCYVDTEKHNPRMTHGETTKEYKDAIIETMRDEALHKLIQVMEGHKSQQLMDEEEYNKITNNLLEKLGIYFDSKRGGTILGDEIQMDVATTAIATMQSHGQSIFPLIQKSTEGRENSVILLDEPETALSVRSQHKLTKILRDLSEKNQLIIATHSPIIMGLADNVLSLEHRKWMKTGDFLETQKQL